MKSTHTMLLFLIGISMTSQAQDLRPRTNLGTYGNEYAATRFAKYESEGFICDAPKPGMPRAVLSGFAPFDGGLENPSGIILGAFGGFSPTANDVDVYGSTREVMINGINYQICFLVTATVWDISAAILISEIERFSPGFVLMTGLGFMNVLFETGSSNIASFAGGYDINGNPVSDNFPEESYVLPPTDPNVPAISSLTWDAEAAKNAVDADVVDMGFQTFLPEAGRASNNYICNNVAFVVTHAVQNFKTELAGGLITLNPQFTSAPKVGFLHYPATAPTDTASLEKWVNILSKIISTQF